MARIRDAVKRDAHEALQRKYADLYRDLHARAPHMSLHDFEEQRKALDKAMRYEMEEIERYNERAIDSYQYVMNPSPLRLASCEDLIREARDTDTHPLHDAEVRDDATFTMGVDHMNILKTKVVGVKFLGNGNSEAGSYEKLYHYFTDDLSIQKDDYCVVIGASGAPCIVKVYEDAVISKQATKMIVGKVDLTAYNEKMKTLVARTAAIKRLKEIEEEQTVQEKYKHLAAANDEAKQLLEMLGMLNGNGSTQIASSTDDGKVIDG